MDIYFVFWVIIQYNPIYFVAQIVTAWQPGAISVDSCVFLQHSPITVVVSSLLFCFFHRTLIFWHCKMLQAHLLSSLPQF